MRALPLLGAPGRLRFARPNRRKEVTAVRALQKLPLNLGWNTDLCTKYSLKPKWRTLLNAGDRAPESFLEIPQDWKSFLFPPAKAG